MYENEAMTVCNNTFVQRCAPMTHKAIFVTQCIVVMPKDESIRTYKLDSACPFEY